MQFSSLFAFNQFSLGVLFCHIKYKNHRLIFGWFNQVTMIFLKYCALLILVTISVVTGQFIYLNTGVFKFIAGIGLPIDVEMSGSSLSWFNNVQVFYKLPDNITYFEPYKIAQKRSVRNTLTRPTFYQGLVKYLERLGFSGSECIHRIICEVGSRRINLEENGLLGEFVHILFSPGNDSRGDLEEFKEAQWQGMFNGSACDVLYQDCYMKENFILSF